MKTKSILLLLAFFIHASLARSQGTAFTYQGYLSQNGAGANGMYDLRFTIYDFGGNSGGNVIAGPLLLPSVAVTNGVFTVVLDFGTGIFNGNSRWLEIGVRPVGSAAVHQLLLPRQSITATPYAIQAAGLSGTLPDAQLSANVARLNGSNAFTGPVTFSPASGSPFAIAGNSSNKVIRGLNADKLNGKASTDFVLKTGDTMTGSLNLPANGLAVGGSQLVVSNGNVGIGTMAPAGVLDVRPPDATSGVGSSIIIKAQRGAASNAGGNLMLSSGDNGVDGANGHIAFGIGAPVLGSDFSANEKMRISSNGNAGIGTNAPKRTLHVRGNGVRVTGVNPQIEFDSDNTDDLAVLGVATLDGGVFSGSRPNDTGLSARSDGNLLFGIGYSEKMRVDNAGNVGIGTASPQSKLDIGDSSNPSLELSTDGVRRLRLDSDNTGSSRVLSQGSASSITFATGTNPDSRMKIDSNGNVGIGTTSPNVPLQVMRQDAQPASIVAGIGDQIVPTANATIVSMTTSSSAYRLYAGYQNGGEVFSVQNNGGAFFNGNVGIGTPTPADRLHIQGLGTSATIMTLRNSSDLTRLRFDYNESVTAIGTDGNTRLDIGAAGFSANASIPNALTLLPNGNVGIGTTAPADALHIIQNQPTGIRWERPGYDTYRIGNIGQGFSVHDVTDNRYDLVFDGTGNVGIGTTSPSARLQVVNATCNGSSWINASDRNLKEKFEDVNTLDVLEQVTKLPIKRWSYKAQPDQTHLGPMAQDFHAAFGVGADDKHIATVDADGVALAAIQGLNQKLEEQVKEKDGQIAELKNRLTTLERLIARLVPETAAARP